MSKLKIMNKINKSIKILKIMKAKFKLTKFVISKNKNTHNRLKGI